MTSRLIALAAVVLLFWQAAVRATDFSIPLNYNWNGLVHSGELNNPDDPNGYRSIDDRGLYVDSNNPTSLGSNPIAGATGITYSIVTGGGVLDVVHLGNTGPGTFRTWDA